VEQLYDGNQRFNNLPFLSDNQYNIRKIPAMTEIHRSGRQSKVIRDAIARSGHIPPQKNNEGCKNQKQRKRHGRTSMQAKAIYHFP